MADSDDGSQSKRDSHYNHQRSSLRSDRSIRTPSRPQSSQLLQDFVLQDVQNTVGDDEREASPSPVIPTRKQSLEKDNRKRKSSKSGGGGSGRGSSRNTNRTNSRGKNIDEYLVPDGYRSLSEIAASSASAANRRYQPSTLEEEQEENRTAKRSRKSSRRTTPTSRRGTPGTDLDITALPNITDESGVPRRATPSPLVPYLDSKPTPAKRRASRLATELYTVSYLIMFSILGTLARLGLQWLTFYPGAPVIFSVLWANVGGTLLMGFLGEDRRLFAQEWGVGAPIPTDPQLNRGPLSDEEKAAANTYVERKAAHARAKKTLPLYIGLATGFCGSFTSFSSFIRDVFFALSNNLPSPINHPYPPGTPQPSTTSTIHRNGGYSFMALLAVIFITIALCYAALQVGQHIAIYTDHLMPTLPFSLFRRIIDPLCAAIGIGVWLGAVFMAIWPPDRPGGPSSRGGWENETWRGQAILACVFAPVGCLARFYISLKLNSAIPSFPLGTFAVNIFGTAVLGMAYDLQHVRIGAGGVGGGLVGCQVLQGIMDGFCGTLTTVSTWIAELHALRRGHSYVYGATSVLVGLATLVAIMGSVRWSVGWTAAACFA